MRDDVTFDQWYAATYGAPNHLNYQTEPMREFARGIWNAAMAESVRRAQKVADAYAGAAADAHWTDGLKPLVCAEAVRSAVQAIKGEG